MKKVLSLTIAAVILLAAALSFASCGGAKGIVGKWKTTIDFEKVMSASGSEAAALFDKSLLEGKTVDLSVEFADDGKYTVDFDKAQVKDIMLSVMEPMLTSVAEAYGMSLDDVLKAQGVSSIEEMVDAQMSGEDGEDTYHKTGEYKYEEGKLTLENSEVKLELSGDTLKFTEIIKSDEDDAMLSDALLPLVFTRG